MEFNYRFYFLRLSNHFVVDSVGRWGGLILFWNANINITIASYTLSHIEAVILNDDTSPAWWFVGFYGNPVSYERHVSWNLLSLICGCSNIPVLIGGDWNEIVNPPEKKKRASRTNLAIQGLANVLIENNLVDLSFQGYPFTWH